MKVLRTKAEVVATVDAWHRAQETIALVPTMGFLHEGHLSLMRIAREHAQRVIVSIFVNPTQFGPQEDFAAYPRDEVRDLARCEAEGVDAVFLPTPTEMYASDASVTLAESQLSKTLCGVTRPTHFQGVLTVVNKLFNLTRADVAVFGMKDAQQLAIIRRMVRDLDLPIRLIPAPIVREPDGLAMSSRNTYLTNEQRHSALCLSRALREAQQAYADGERDATTVLSAMRTVIEGTPLTEIDYLVAVDVDTLVPVEVLRPRTLLAMAVKVGKTRLIDNVVL